MGIVKHGRCHENDKNWKYKYILNGETRHANITKKIQIVKIHLEIAPNLKKPFHVSYVGKFGTSRRDDKSLIWSLLIIYV